MTPSLTDILDYVRTVNGSVTTKDIVAHCCTVRDYEQFTMKYLIGKVCTKCGKLCHQGYLVKISPGVWVAKCH